MIEFGPGDSLPITGPAGRSAVDAHLVAPCHPFLRHGRWRGFAAGDGGEITARIIASVDPRQQTGTGAIGCVGFASLAAGETADDPATLAARRVLARAMDWLRDEGVVAVRAPVQLSTWYGHRVVTRGFPDEGGLPAFPLEPSADRVLLTLLETGGFSPAHRAVSCLVDPRVVVEQAAPALDRAGRSGLTDRPIRLDDLGGELALFHGLSVRIFRDTWGVSEIDGEEFAAIYRPLAGIADPGLIRILEDSDGRPIGFALGLGWPDEADFASSGGPAFVLKTIGVTPEGRGRYPGIGVALAAMVHRAALERGYCAGIHALMARGSVAHRLSLRWGREFREYATFERGWS